MLERPNYEEEIESVLAYEDIDRKDYVKEILESLVSD